MKNKTAILILMLLLLLISCSNDNKSILIKYSIIPGQEIFYTSSVNTHWKVFNDDSVMVDNVTSSTYVIGQIFTEKVSNSTSRLKQSHYQFESIPKNFKELNFDSSCRKIDLTYDMNQSGEVSNLSFGENINPSAYDYFTNTMEQGVPHFPQDMISPGYSWTQNTKVIIEDEILEASTRYNFVSIVRAFGYDCAVIQYDGNMIIPVNSLPNEEEQKAGLEIIKLKGVMYFAFKEGLMIHQHDTWETKGEYHYTDTDSDKKPYESYRFLDVEMQLETFNKL